MLRLFLTLLYFSLICCSMKHRMDEVRASGRSTFISIILWKGRSNSQANTTSLPSASKQGSEKRQNAVSIRTRQLGLNSRTKAKITGLLLLKYWSSSSDSVERGEVGWILNSSYFDKIIVYIFLIQWVTELTEIVFRSAVLCTNQFINFHGILK